MLNFKNINFLDFKKFDSIFLCIFYIGFFVLIIYELDLNFDYYRLVS